MSEIKDTLKSEIEYLEKSKSRHDDEQKESAPNTEMTVIQGKFIFQPSSRGQTGEIHITNALGDRYKTDVSCRQQ